MSERDDELELIVRNELLSYTSGDDSNPYEMAAMMRRVGQVCRERGDREGYERGVREEREALRPLVAEEIMDVDSWPSGVGEVDMATIAENVDAIFWDRPAWPSRRTDERLRRSHQGERLMPKCPRCGSPATLSWMNEVWRLDDQCGREPPQVPRAGERPSSIPPEQRCPMVAGRHQYASTSIGVICIFCHQRKP